MQSLRPVFHILVPAGSTKKRLYVGGMHPLIMKRESGQHGPIIVRQPAQFKH